MQELNPTNFNTPHFPSTDRLPFDHPLGWKNAKFLPVLPETKFLSGLAVFLYHD